MSRKVATFRASPSAQLTAMLKLSLYTVKIFKTGMTDGYFIRQSLDAHNDAKTYQKYRLCW